MYNYICIYVYRICICIYIYICTGIYVYRHVYMYICSAHIAAPWLDSSSMDAHIFIGKMTIKRLTKGWNDEMLLVPLNVQIPKHVMTWGFNQPMMREKSASEGIFKMLVSQPSNSANMGWYQNMVLNC